jgi:hypothetical protein
MLNLSRRSFLGVLAAAANATFSSTARTGRTRQKGKKIPVLHATDLFRPHIDPDDHWDLACVYALAYQGDIDLKGVLIDYPPRKCDSDVAAVAQMNFITGLSVPVAVGSPQRMKSRHDVRTDAQPGDHNAVKLVLDVLRESSSPVVINITGCCRNIAIAGKLQPRLFAEKCAAIYLNAGTGSPKKAVDGKLEYNVSLDRAAYAAIFEMPCPVYWMPCFEQMADPWKVREFGTFYKFRQDEILPHLSDRMQNYFAYMFAKVKSSDWLAYLTGPRNSQLLAEHGRKYRNMWCTGGFLHAAGKTVSRNGRIVLPSRSPAPIFFVFDPIKVRCDENGVTHWVPGDKSSNRYISHVLDVEIYQAAMTKALKSLLVTLP